jgi:hypothetical protein
VIDAKGGENKGQRDKWISYHLRDFENSRIELLVWISYHLRDFENSRIELLVCQNSFIVSRFVKTLLLSLLSKVGFLWGEVLIMGKRGVL